MSGLGSLNQTVLSLILATVIMGEAVSDSTAIAFSLVGLVSGVIFARLMGKYFSNNSEYQVKIVSIDKFHTESSSIVPSN